MAFAVTFSPMHNTREIMTDASIAERDLIRDAKTTAISTLVAKKKVLHIVCTAYLMLMRSAKIDPRTLR